MPNKNSNKDNLFREELNLIESSRGFLSSYGEENEELAVKYSELIREYEKLLGQTRKIFSISDKQSVVIKRKEAEIKKLLDNSNQGFLSFGRDLLINKEYSAECHNIFQKRIGGLLITDVLAPEDLEQREYFKRTLHKVYELLPAPAAEEYLGELPSQILINGKIVEIEYKIVENALDNNLEPRIMVICTDITEKHLAAEKIKFLSYHDKLTSLYNRAYIDKAIEGFNQPECLPFSIIIGDMNGLKLTNDVFGHKEGDKLLVNMAEVLNKCTRKVDIVGRWGGDEFIILLPNTDEKACEAICQRIMETSREYEPDPIELSVSLGSSTIRQGEDIDFPELFRNAENDMYSNKSSESPANTDKILQSMEKMLQNITSNNREHIERVCELTGNLVERLAPYSLEKNPRFIRLLAILQELSDNSFTKKQTGEVNGNPPEGDAVKRYSEIGYRMAKALGEIEIANTILSVQERWDGQGFPRGLKGEEIPFLARVLAIVHRYEMIRESQKQKTLAHQELVQIIRQDRGNHLDPQLTDLFLAMISNEDSR